MKLTAVNIGKIPAPPKPTKYYDLEVRPLFLKVTPTGRKGWYVHIKLPSGKYTDHKLGDYSMFSPKEARDEANEKLLAARRGTDVAKARKRDASGTLQGFMDNRYKTWVLQNHKDSTNTLRVLQETFSDFSDTLLTDIDVSAVEEWRLGRLKEKTSKGTRVAPQTINRNTALLRAALGKAKLWGLIDKNPLDDLPLLKVEQRPVEFLSSKQLDKLMAALHKRDLRKIQERKEYNKWLTVRGKEPMVDFEDLELSISDYLTPLVTLVLHAGLRLGEALSLRWSDISADNVLTVRSGKTGSIRFVPMSFDVEVGLMWWRRIHNATLGEDYRGPLVDTMFITVGRGGAPRALRSVKTSWGNVTSGLSFGCDFRTLRRTFGSTLIQKGTPLFHVSKLLGHANVETTQRWYLNLGLDDYKEAVALLNTIDF